MTYAGYLGYLFKKTVCWLPGISVLKRVSLLALPVSFPRQLDTRQVARGFPTWLFSPGFRTDIPDSQHRAYHCWRYERPTIEVKDRGPGTPLLGLAPGQLAQVPLAFQSNAIGLARRGQWNLWLPPAASRCRRARPAPTCQAGNISSRRQRPLTKTGTIV